MKLNNKIIVSAILVVLGVACRLLPHPFNFAPIAAVALFAGAYLGVIYAITLPVLAMLIGDIFLGFYGWQMTLAVYGSYVLAGIIGLSLRKHKSVQSVISLSLAASILFFLITNYAVWQFSGWYALTWQGLVNCYILALPFLRNTLVGDLFYVGAIFGSYELVRYLVLEKKLKIQQIS